MVLILVDTKDLDLLLNTGEYWGTIAEYVQEQRATVGVPLGRTVSPAVRRRQRGNPHSKKRRKTAYQGAYSAAYKRLKKKHPRMSFGSLSKKAHAAARKKVK